MANIVSLYSVLLAIYVPSIMGTEKQASKEWIFQFDLKNNKNWDDYQVVQGGAETSDKLIGFSNGCTQRIPVIFKQLCVNWNDNTGFSLKFQSANNINIDPNYDDMLWYYGDHKTAKTAEKVAKAKYVDLEEKELTEISHYNTLRRRLAKKSGQKKCYWYNDAKACAHVHASNKNLMTVSVGLNEQNNAAAAQDYEEYYEDNEYYDDNDDDEEEEYDDEEYDDVYDDGDYDEYDLDEIYDEYMQQMQQQQALYNQQWANYLQNLNDLYWQNYFQQQQQQQAAAAVGYNEYMYNNMDSDDKNTGSGAGDGAQFGISESSIMEKAEAEARRNVEAKMEKKMESRLEKEMMHKLDSGLSGVVHKKQSNYGGDMDDDHMNAPASDGEMEEDQNEREPHDSISADE